ncbi:MAG: hypothetical protein ACKV19_13030 [Verrucomicrobiales bacterium]
MFEASYRVQEGVSGMTLRVQASSQLSNWTDLPVLTTHSQGNGTAIITVRDDMVFTAATRRFLRLQATQPQRRYLRPARPRLYPGAT